MIFQGRIVCNCCCIDMGVLHVDQAPQQHYCPDCIASGNPVDMIGEDLKSAISHLVTIAIQRGRSRVAEALR